MVSPQATRRKPWDRRKIPAVRAMLAIIQKHQLGEPTQLAFQLAYEHHRLWLYGAPWEMQDAVWKAADAWFDQPKVRASEQSYARERAALREEREFLSLLMDEAIALKNYYEGQSTALH